MTHIITIELNGGPSKAVCAHPAHFTETPAEISGSNYVRVSPLHPILLELRTQSYASKYSRSGSVWASWRQATLPSKNELWGNIYETRHRNLTAWGPLTPKCTTWDAWNFVWGGNYGDNSGPTLHECHRCLHNGNTRHCAISNILYIVFFFF